MIHDFRDISVKGTLRVEWDDIAESWTMLSAIVVTWRTGTILVPAGFTTDLSSVPEWAQSIIPQIGRHNVPSVVHDWCYVHRWRGSRVEADRLFLALMAWNGVAWLRRTVMYLAVRIGGKRAWDTDD